jgi:hypothetical protein
MSENILNVVFAETFDRPVVEMWYEHSLQLRDETFFKLYSCVTEQNAIPVLLS